MSFKIAYQAHAKVHCFRVFGNAANHLDSIARYVTATVADQQGVILDIRAVTTRPRADKVFIHVLKYPNVCFRKIALVDLNDNRWFYLLYERLVRKRGCQVCFFGDVETAHEWLLRDDPASKPPPHSIGFLTQLVAVLRHCVNPMRLLHGTTTSR